MDNNELSGSNDHTRAAADLLNDGFARLKLSRSAQRQLVMTVTKAREFFELGTETKIAASLPQQCGYRPMGIEYSANPDRPDLIESFTYSPRAEAAATTLFDEAAQLWRAMGVVFEFMSNLAAGTFNSLDRRFEGHLSERGDDFFSEWSRLQINFSRPTQNAGSEIHEYHEDGDFLTIATASAPGLQLELPNSSVANGPSTFDEVILMPGQILHLMSGGEIRPAYHRVLSIPEIEKRIAVMFFGDLAPQVCQPWHRGEVNDGIDIGHVVMTSVEKFGLKGFTDS